MKKVYVTGSVSTCYEMKLFFTRVRELFPVIDDFICAQGNELVNEKICHNECYSIRFGRRKTFVYLNGE